MIYYCNGSCSSNSADHTTGTIHNYPGNSTWYTSFSQGTHLTGGGTACGQYNRVDYRVQNAHGGISTACAAAVNGMWGIGAYWH